MNGTVGDSRGQSFERIGAIILLGTNFGGTAAVTEAFDEPLTMAQVLAIVTPFIA